MAELAGSVVVHGSDQDHQLLCELVSLRVKLPFLRRDQRLEHLQIFHKVRDILGLHAEDGGVTLRQDAGLVLAKIGRGKVLPDQILLLYDVAVAENEPTGTSQRIQQAVQVRRDMAARAAGTEHHDLDRYVSGIFHRPAPQTPLSGGQAGAAHAFCR